MQAEEDEELTLDVTTLSFIIALLIHSGALFYWGGRMSKAVTILERVSSDHDKRIRELEQLTAVYE